MRLIDADALNTELRNCPYVVDFNKVVEIIDNAPTVDTTFREVVAYECGQKSERPTGRWVRGDINGEGWDYYCSRCKHITNEDINEIDFCPKCGAYMRVKGGRR